MDLTPCCVVTLSDVFAVSSPTVQRQATFSGVSSVVTLPVLTAAIALFPSKLIQSFEPAVVLYAAILFRIGSVWFSAWTSSAVWISKGNWLSAIIDVQLLIFCFTDLEYKP
jgi:hypothetical protein